jgi:hypothetical protein
LRFDKKRYKGKILRNRKRKDGKKKEREERNKAVKIRTKESRKEKGG